MRGRIKRGGKDGGKNSEPHRNKRRCEVLSCYKIRIMANGCPKGSHTKNHERRLMLSGETGSVSETIMRPESEA